MQSEKSQTEHYAAISTIAGLPIAIVGLYFGYLQVGNSTQAENSIISHRSSGSMSGAAPTVVDESKKGFEFAQRLERRLKNSLAKLDARIVELKSADATMKRDADAEQSLKVVCDLADEVREVLNGIDEHQKEIAILRAKQSEIELKVKELKSNPKVPRETIGKLEMQMLETGKSVTEVQERTSTEIKMSEAVLEKMKTLPETRGLITMDDLS